ncbi:DUF3703 domain-containing protein [Jiulongibacter sp. NS-SX5]|uniref:DUF3703 domain-containing protein n=1 Tax=Jiulongibacter sp. NS-SX5 TaxID=3463854 RepID=UPI0040589853
MSLFNTSMPAALKPFYYSELVSYDAHMETNNLQAAWRSLERAHILGQKYPLTHSEVHWKMLLFGFKIKSAKEVFGQILRLFTGGVKSFVGVIPVGNPGGSNVPPLKSYEIEPELKDILMKTTTSELLKN